MGGWGSGRRWQDGRDTTSDLRSLDVRRLQRDGLLSPGQAFVWSWHRNDKRMASISIRTEANRVTLDYRHQSRGGPWQSMNYPVWLSWTDCTYGGQRAWFLCPANSCGRRVALLYIGSSGIFACRHCYRLAYDSQRETADDRALRRANTIRRRLGWEPGILNGNGWKPKGMHWRTFERLKAEHDAFARASLDGMAQRLSLTGHRLASLDAKLKGDS